MLVIYAEKASLAKAIAGVLHAGKRIPLEKEPSVGHYEFNFHGEPAVLCHGVGHLAQLIPAKLYDEKYAKWDLDVFPCIPESFRCAPKAATKNCIALVKSLFDKADWIINATDPDREGELIFSYVYEACKCKAPYKRVWIEDLTDEKISHAFSHLREPDEQLSAQHSGCMEDLQKAGRARDIADWLTGNNLTVAATKKYGGYDNMLSVGRVQTPTLALVVNREKVIKGHVKTPFWKLLAVFSSDGNNLEAEYSGGNFTVEAEAQKMLAVCGTSLGKVTKLETKRKSVSAPLLYNATQLQIAASKKLGWESEKTIKIMQSLYENKFMSYPRTSSEHLTEAMIPEVTITLQKLLRTPDYEAYARPEAQWAAFTKRHFDDSKVGSHPAIIPTVNVPESLEKLSEDEKQLYDLLAKSIIRMIYPKATLDDTVAEVDTNGCVFKASGSVVANAGWYAVDAMPEKKKILPTVKEGQNLPGEYALKKGETEPPKRYTEADLLAAMELAGQNLEDEEARTLMKLQKKGLGTDATRVPIIKGLFDKEYIARKGKSIIPTEKGIYLIDTLPVEEIKSAELTGEWEKELNDIALGKADYNAFIGKITDATRRWYSAIAQSSSSEFLSENDKKMLCPMCGKRVRKHDWGWGCTGYKEGCKFSIRKEICGKKVTEAQVIMLMSSGRTAVIKGFTAKSGSSFDAALVLDKKTGDLKFDFPEKKTVKKG